MKENKVTLIMGQLLSKSLANKTQKHETVFLSIFFLVDNLLGYDR